jgi:hypothetical protein
MKKLRRTLLWSMLVVISLIGFASGSPDPPLAMLQPRGKVQLNGSPTVTRVALHLGDWIETETESLADITAHGSFVQIMQRSFVKFKGDLVELSHGGVVIATSTRIALKAESITIVPAASKPTNYEVADNGDSVVIVARAGQLTITDILGTSTLEEGEQSTRPRHQPSRVAR